MKKFLLFWLGRDFRVDSKIVGILAIVIASLLSFISLALHSPGHLSVDTSVQLYEARIGKSISWNPPFMSALLNWLGGGEVATAFFVLICTTLTYLSLGIVAAIGFRNGGSPGCSKVSIWRPLLALIFLLNPLLFLYVGIVWKDVLFSSAITAAIALSFVGAFSSLRCASIVAVIAAILLAMSMQVRQQGVFMAPILLALPIMSLVISRKLSARIAFTLSLCVILVFSGALFVSKSFVDKTIVGSGDKSTSFALRNIYFYDIAGIVAHTNKDVYALSIPISTDQVSAVRGAYTSDRIDYLAKDPVVSAWISGLWERDTRGIWWSAIQADPLAFYKHKRDVFLTNLSFYGVSGCSPAYAGIAGISEYLEAVGIKESFGARDSFVFGIASFFIDWPVFRHWFYVALLLFSFVFISIGSFPARIRSMCLVITSATCLFYLSFLPTTLACDFRYMFSGILLVTVLWFVILSCGSFVKKTRVDERGK